MNGSGWSFWFRGQVCYLVSGAVKGPTANRNAKKDGRMYSEWSRPVPAPGLTLWGNGELSLSLADLTLDRHRVYRLERAQVVVLGSLSSRSVRGTF